MLLSVPTRIFIEYQWKEKDKNHAQKLEGRRSLTVEVRTTESADNRDQEQNGKVRYMPGSIKAAEATVKTQIYLVRARL